MLRSTAESVARIDLVEADFEKAGIEKGPLFRARRASRSEALSERPMDPAPMHLTVLAYLE